jgi:hypothetical protein
MWDQFAWYHVFGIIIFFYVLLKKIIRTETNLIMVNKHSNSGYNVYLYVETCVYFMVSEKWSEHYECFCIPAGIDIKPFF